MSRNQPGPHIDPAIWPQAREKAIVDLVNGIEVAGELARVKESRRGFFRNAAALFTGREARERDAIETALVEGQISLVQWIGWLLESQAETDYAVARIAAKLVQTRQEIAQRAEEVRSGFARLDERLSSMTHHFEELEDGAVAHVVLNKVFKQAESLQFAPLVLGFWVVDRLWWSDFGAFQRSQRTQRRLADELMQLAVVSLKELLADRLSTSATDLVDLHALSQDLGPPEVLGYLAAGGDALSAPLHRVLSGETDPQAAWPLSLPKWTSPERIADRLMHESMITSRRRVHGQE
jgi:YjcZ-like protein